MNSPDFVGSPSRIAAWAPGGSDGGPGPHWILSGSAMTCAAAGCFTVGGDGGCFFSAAACALAPWLVSAASVTAAARPLHVLRILFMNPSLNRGARLFLTPLVTASGAAARVRS